MGVISEKEAFKTGHNLGYTAVYFDQVLLAAKLASSKDEEPKKHAQNMIENLQRVGGNFAQRLQFIHSTAEKANFPARPLPTIPTEFHPWVQTMHLSFLEFWPATDPVGCLFVIGHAIGEIRNALIIGNLSIDFEENLKMELQSQRKNIPLRLGETTERFNRAILILENLQPQPPYATFLRSFYTGLQTQLSTSIALMKLDSKSARKAINLNHKLLQILGQAEFEIEALLPGGHST